jgi:serine/threonine protein kinase
MEPRQIGPYTVLGEMGRGGAGIVHRCRDVRTGTLAAVKTAREDNLAQRNLLRREIAVMSHLGGAAAARPDRAPSAQLVDSGIDQGLLWYAMELVEGIDLATLVARLWRMSGPGGSVEPGLPSHDPLVIEEARLDRSRAGAGYLAALLPWLAELAGRVAAIHGEGVVHGDLAPRNVLLSASRGVVLVDFAHALHTSSGGMAREIAQSEGVVHGTPGYMAPEQIRGETLDDRCDVYALGCLFYEVLAGRGPFVASDPTSLQRQHLHVEPRPPSTFIHGVPAAIDVAITQALAKNPRHRTTTAADLAGLLEASMSPPAPGPTRGDGQTEDRRAAGEIRSPERDPRAAGAITLALHRPALIGRERPLDALTAMVSSAAAGNGGCALVRGESGVGKTRLVNELGVRAQALGFDVMTGYCFELPRATPAGESLSGPPLQPLAPLLHRAMDWSCSTGGEPASTSNREELLAHLAVLVPYEPALATIPGLPATVAVALPADLARARVLRSLVECVRWLAAHRRLALFIDDLQWADDLTLAFVEAAASRTFGDVPVLVVGTYRQEQGDSPGLRSVLAALPPERHLALGRLEAEDVREMAQSMFGSRTLLPTGVVDLLHGLSEGNPFFVAEYVRAAVTRGLVRRTPGGDWTFDGLARLGTGARSGAAPDADPDRDAGETEPPLPATLHSLMKVRQEGLSAAALAVLETAAVLGREFDADLLELLDPETRQAGAGGAIESALDELVAREILKREGARRFRFSHDKFREANETASPPARRRQLHRRAAGWLQARPGSAAERRARAATIGSHWAHGGKPRLAFPPLELAARHAEASCANAQAAMLYRLALEQAQSAALSSPRRSALWHRRALRVAEALGDILVRTARHDEAQTRYGAALELAGPAMGDDEGGLAAVRLSRKRAQSFCTLHRYGNALAALDSAEARLGPLSSLVSVEQHREWIEIQQGRFWVHYWQKDGDAADAQVALMAPVVERHGTTMQRGMFFHCAANDVLVRERYQYSERAMSFAVRAVREMEGDGALAHPAEAALFRFDLGFILLLGKPGTVGDPIEHFARALADAERIGDATLISRVLTYWTIALRRQRDGAGMRAMVARALPAAMTAQLDPYIGACVACQAWLRWTEGDLSTSRELMRDAERWWSRGPHVFPFLWVGKFVSLAVSHADDALDDVPATIATLLAPNQHLLPPDLRSALTQTADACAAGDRAAAHASLDRSLRLALDWRYL